MTVEAGLTAQIKALEQFVRELDAAGVQRGDAARTAAMRILERKRLLVAVERRYQPERVLAGRL